MMNAGHSDPPRALRRAGDLAGRRVRGASRGEHSGRDDDGPLRARADVDRHHAFQGGRDALLGAGDAPAPRPDRHVSRHSCVSLGERPAVVCETLDLLKLELRVARYHDDGEVEIGDEEIPSVDYWPTPD